MFIEEPVQCQNVDVMADIARGTHLPIATGERVFTKWGFRDCGKKGRHDPAAGLCHAGGITEVRLIAGMAESYYAAVAPQPVGPISGPAGLQMPVDPQFPLPGTGALGRATSSSRSRSARGTSICPGPGLGVTGRGA
ncbi:MAG: hypothetical protein Ct9H300mP1_23960 [Planctomycetaceae bacterium]|nr:MAG: hypothetical protein Ct9H300mP1_23960 [Planctomycetaceae bacterium]